MTARATRRSGSGTKRQRVRQYGNAVTPPVAEVLVSALVECIQGHDIDWERAA